MNVTRRHIEALDKPVWYHKTDANTVIVFVHGFNSNNLACWLSDGPEPTYWPDLVGTDSRLASAALFLGGFPTNFESGDYGLSDAAQGLFLALKNPASDGTAPALERERLVFVCHSTGGLVAQYMLTQFANEFRDKFVGLALIACPSLGSPIANLAAPLLRGLGVRLGLQLRWMSETVRDLDYRFHSLVQGERCLPRLCGIEGVETHSVYRDVLPRFIRFLFQEYLVVVGPSTGARHFAEPRPLPNTDHFSAAKPSSLLHPSHVVLADLVAMLDRAMASAQPAMPPFLSTREVPMSPSNRLFYGARAHTFVGRETELAELGAFLDSSPTFSWWLVTGAAGSGKSRLALEICLHRAATWTAGFLSRQVDVTRLAFTPGRPTLIVIDYILGNESLVRECLLSLSQRADSFAEPVRVLLLERDWGGQVLDQALGTGGDRHIIESARYREQDLRLPGLGREHLLQVANESGSGGDRVPAQNVLTETLERVADGLPLVAALIGEGLQAGTSEQTTDRDQLLLGYLKREEEHRWSRAGVDKQYRNLMAISTLFQGVDLTQVFDEPSLAALAPKRDDYQPEVLRAAIGATDWARVPPISPDLVGEFFVLRHLKPRHVADNERVENWRRLIWEHHHQARAFVGRCIDDFPDDEVAERLIEAPPESVTDARDSSALLLQSRLLKAIQSESSRQRAARSLDALDRVAGSAATETLHHNLRVTGHLWWAWVEAQTGKTDEATMRIEKWTERRLALADIRQSLWANDPMFVCPISAALTELTHAYRRLNNISKMSEMIECLLAMAESSPHREPVVQAVEASVDLFAAAQTILDGEFGTVGSAYDRFRCLEEAYYFRRGLLIERPDPHQRPSQMDFCLVLGAAATVTLALRGRRADEVASALDDLERRATDMPAFGLLSNLFIGSLVKADDGLESVHSGTAFAKISVSSQSLTRIARWYAAHHSHTSDLDPRDLNDLHAATARTLAASALALGCSDVVKALEFLKEAHGALCVGTRTMGVSAQQLFGGAAVVALESLLALDRREEGLEVAQMICDVIGRFGAPGSVPFFIRKFNVEMEFAARTDDIDYLTRTSEMRQQIALLRQEKSVDHSRWN